MKKLAIILGFSGLVFSSCSTDNISPTQDNKSKVLQEVDLTGKVKSSQGAELTLLKLSDKCRLVYNIYGETGQEEYNFDFKKNKVIESEYLSYNYKPNDEGIIDLGNLSENDIVLIKKEKANDSKFYELKKFINLRIFNKNCS